MQIVRSFVPGHLRPQSWHHAPNRARDAGYIVARMAGFAITAMLAFGGIAGANVAGANTAHAQETDFPANGDDEPFALMDLRDTLVWNLNSYQWLEPDETALETLIARGDHGPMHLDFVMQSQVPSYCQLHFNPTVCSDHGAPVSWFADLPQKICMDVPANLALAHRDVLKGVTYLCLEPRENLVLPDGWEHSVPAASAPAKSTKPAKDSNSAAPAIEQTHLAMHIEPGALVVQDGVAIVDILVLDALNTPLSVLSADGYGPARTGMSENQLRDALGPQIDLADGGTNDGSGNTTGQSCGFAQSALGPTGLGYMLVAGKLARVSVYSDEYDVSTSLIRTDRGISIGATADAVMAAYDGKLLRETSDVLEPGGYYLTWWQDKGKKRGIRFEITADDTVSAIHAGTSAITLGDECE